MRKPFLIVKNNFKIIFKKKSSIFTYILLPIISLLFLMFIQFLSKAEVYNIGVINKDRNILSQDMVSYLGNIKKINLFSIEEDEIKDKVIKGETSYVIVIPEDFENSILKKQPKDIEIITIKDQYSTVWIKNYINMYIENLMLVRRVAKDSKEFYHIYEGYKINGKMFLEGKNIEDVTGKKEFTTASMGIFIIFLMYTSINISKLIIKEKREKTYYRICASPISSKQYVLGNVITNLSVIGFQLFVVILILMKIIKLDANYLNFFILMMFFGIVVVSLGVLIISFANSSMSVSGITNFIVVPSSMLGGCFWNISNRREILKKISLLMPQSYVIDGIEKIQENLYFKDLIPNLVILILFSLAFLSIAIYKMRINKSAEEFL
ncbi:MULTISPECIES: ABC transporter permease [Clostridium]|uniref:ABC transporter permease n=1 Tax=Clostridium faecium TaxID=2762223 RepID=A0ABR8YRI8_9CLOT|nr:MULTISPECIES: ABC transporter permease [Clostridium]MBD8046848.1 ABC transporter permease [Clostridium faecium]MDU1350167.1 ABC transporter permease [Clostridium argentinense]